MLLIREPVDGVLVLHVSRREVEGHRVNAVAVGVQQLVVAVVGCPSEDGAGHEHLVEACCSVEACTCIVKAAHVHVERSGVETLTVVCKNVVFVVVACSGVGATCAGRSVTVAHSATVDGAHAVVYVVTNAVSICVDTRTTAHTACVEDVAVTVTCTVSNAFTATHTALVENVAVAVARAVRNARTTAHTALVNLGTAAVVLCCRGVVVARHVVGTTQHFVFVTHTVAVCVVDARTVTVQQGVVLVRARTVVVRRSRIVVAGRVVHATTHNVDAGTKRTHTVK